MNKKKVVKKTLPKVAVGADTARFERLLRRVASKGRYVLRLFITGTTQRSSEAIATIRSLCDEHLAGRYDLEVVDIYQQPGAAVGEQIVAAPTLVRKRPMPIKRMVGDLSNREKVVVAMELREDPRQRRKKQPES